MSASFVMACDWVRAAAITLRYSCKPPRHLRNLKLWKYYGLKLEASVDGGAKCDLEVCLSGESLSKDSHASLVQTFSENGNGKPHVVRLAECFLSGGNRDSVSDNSGLFIMFR